MRLLFLEQKNAANKQELAKITADYRAQNREASAKHKQIAKDEMAKINEQYKKMWEDEKRDYQQSMMNNRDAETRRQRRLSYSIFKESFPQMKQNDVERRMNSLDFDRETELNSIKARYTQQKTIIKDNMKQDREKFEEECFPLKLATKKYDEAEKALKAKKDDALLHAELIFFFKFEDNYQLIPDDITNRIIQGLGNKVFTKTFRVEVPHNGYKEDPKGIEFKVVSFVNYGDVKLYKCSGELFGEKVNVYINQERDIQLGEKVFLSPQLDLTQIYENDLNIRLY